MNSTADNSAPEIVARNAPSKTDEPTGTRDGRQSYLVCSVMLASLPFISFLAQFGFSVRAGTQQILIHHLTVTGLDWIFVPFNFWVVRVVDWRRGERLYVIVVVSVVLTVLTHAFWQSHGLDPGHMITSSGVVLPAGWVHLAFSILEMVLLVAFVFCRRPNAPALRIVTMLASIYFLAISMCGYLIHGEFVITDVVVVTSGLFFVLIYPGLVGRRRV